VPRLPSPRALTLGILAFVLAASAALLLLRLGHAALWDDEANTALFADSVWRTGDTLALIGDGHNLVAYSQGGELTNLRNRVLPPLQYYVAALGVGPAPGSALAARLPFALCGLLTVLLLLRWLLGPAQAPADRQASPLAAAVFGLALLGNVSFFLYARQCRYYALAILLTTAIAYLYEHLRGWRQVALMALLSALLWAANYMSYAALYACLAADYLLFRRRAPAMDRAQDPLLRPAGLALLSLPQALLIGALLTVYSPLGKYEGGAGPLHHVRLFFWNLRDLNASEMGVGLLLLLAPVVGAWRRDLRLLRGALALLLYVAVVAAISPQPAGTTRAYVRYLAPLLPLCIALSARTVLRLCQGRHPALPLCLSVVAFGTNALHGGPLSGDVRTLYNRAVPPDVLRSTPLRYLGELAAPPPSSYALAASWVRDNVRPGQSVWVQPGYATYPLMWAAPAPIYAWQLADLRGQFQGLSEIHVQGRVPPDYVIVFGPKIRTLWETLERLGHRRDGYEPAATLDVHWYDLTRPEIFWHAFSPVRGFDPQTEAVYIFRRRR
jgi:hypothetical protein